VDEAKQAVKQLAVDFDGARRAYPAVSKTLSVRVSLS
jgi:hypothetical protein